MCEQSSLNLCVMPWPLIAWYPLLFYMKADVNVIIHMPYKLEPVSIRYSECTWHTLHKYLVQVNRQKDAPSMTHVVWPFKNMLQRLLSLTHTHANRHVDILTIPYRTCGVDADVSRGLILLVLWFSSSTSRADKSPVHNTHINTHQEYLWTSRVYFTHMYSDTLTQGTCTLSRRGASWSPLLLFNLPGDLWLWAEVAL